MKSMYRNWGLPALLLLGFTALFGQAQPPKAPPALTAQDAQTWLDGLFSYGLPAADVASVVVTVVKDGKILTSRGYGHADIASKRPVDPATTMYRPGSVSKLVTWTAVMQLVEQGKVDLDQDVNTYLDYKLPPREGRPVTLRNLMTHTAGFEECIRGLIIPDQVDFQTIGASLKRWVPDRVYAPGKVPAYSNYGASLAGYIVERVSGMPFDAYVDAHIFQPLGMKHSTFTQPLPERFKADIATTYETASAPPKYFELISMAPAGSLSASAEDMGRFMIAHLNEGRYNDAQILQPATARMMHDFELTCTPGAHPMALGFYRQDKNGQTIIAHGGDTMFFHSELILLLKQNTGLYLSIDGAGKNKEAYRLRQAIEEGFLDRYFPAPPAAPLQALPTAREHGAQVAGSYWCSRNPRSSFLYSLALMGMQEFHQDKNGDLVWKDFLTGKARSFREVAPYAFQDLEGQDRLLFAVEGGRVEHMSIEPYSPIMIFFPASSWQAFAGSKGLLAIVFAVLLAAVALWPVAALVRRRCGKPVSLSPKALRWYRASRLAALANLAFAGGFALWLQTMGEYHLPVADALQWLFQILGYLALAGTVAAVGNAVLAWTEPSGWWRKVNSAALGLACVLASLMSLGLHLLKLGLNY
jgi:CubicO group peptidase (beta-lactamase class C family)